MRTFEASSDLDTMDAGVELATGVQGESNGIDQPKEAFGAPTDDLFQHDSSPASDSTDMDAYPPSATVEAMETYVHLLDNVYHGRTTGKSIAGDESMPCDCRYDPEVDDPSAACGDDSHCINRMMFMECNEDDCACGRFCQNRRFQLRQYARVDVFKTENKGYGLRALTDLPANAFVIEYMGEVITHKEFVRRTKKYEAEGLSHYYSMTLTNEEIIDATKKGCLARFINHSCNPNCVTQKWVVGKAMRVGIFTRRPVKAGEELSFDYQFQRYGATAQTCYCGDPICTGIIGGRPTASSDDRDMSDEEETNIIKKPIKKPGRKPAIRPLKSLNELPMFAKEILESGGKLSLVHRLLSRLELTLPTADAKEILKEFVRLRGIILLKIWLSEWKTEEDIVLKILRVLDCLPLQYRNKVEDCSMFDTLARFVEHEKVDIQTLAKSLIQKWSALKIYNRIPKRSPKRPLADDDSKEGENDTKVPAKKRCVNSTREIFDPDNGNHEYLSLHASSHDIRSILRLPSPMRSISSKRPRSPYRRYHDTYSRSYYSKHYPYNVAEKRIPGRYRHAYDREMSPVPRPRSYKYDYRWDKPSERYRSYTSSASFVDGGFRSRPGNTHIDEQLPPNWRSAKTEDGRIYYYNTISRKVQWELPEDRSSFIEGVSQSAIDEMIEKSRMQLEQRRRIEEEKVAAEKAAAAAKEEEATEKKRLMEEEKLKKVVAPMVVKCLQKQHKDLWDGDKHIFKELARLITRHIVDCEKKAGRSLSKINEEKIAKTISSHGKYFAGKVTGNSAAKNQESKLSAT